MEKLITLKPNDIISFKYGSERIVAKVLSNDGSQITWIGLNWRKDCAESFSYPSLLARNIVFVGKSRPLLKKLFSLNFSDIDFNYNS